MPATMFVLLRTTAGSCRSRLSSYLHVGLIWRAPPRRDGGEESVGTKQLEYSQPTKQGQAPTYVSERARINYPRFAGPASFPFRSPCSWTPSPFFWMIWRVIFPCVTCLTILVFLCCIIRGVREGGGAVVTEQPRLAKGSSILDYFNRSNAPTDSET